MEGIFQIVQTPFFENGEIDYKSLERQARFALDCEVHGLVMPANASEFFTLSDDERKDIVRYFLSVVRGAVPVIVGVQAQTWRAAVAFAEHAQKHGASGLMAIPPYLRKANRSGIIEYYRRIAEIGLDVVVQNAPGPLGTPIDSDSLAELFAAHTNISYLKEEIPPILQRISKEIEATQGHCRGVFGGANGLLLGEELDRGACGNMPAGGVIDVQVKQFNAHQAGDRDTSLKIQYRLMPLLIHAVAYGVAFHKYLLWKRGVLDSPATRDPQAVTLDRIDIATIHERWNTLIDLTNQSYPLLD